MQVPRDCGFQTERVNLLPGNNQEGGLVKQQERGWEDKKGVWLNPFLFKPQQRVILVIQQQQQKDFVVKPLHIPDS